MFLLTSKKPQNKPNYSETKKEEFLGEIGYLVENTVGHLQEIHKDCSFVEGLCLLSMFPYRVHTFVMLTVICVVLFAQGNSVNIPRFGMPRGQGSSDGRLSSFRSSVQTVITRAE